MDDKLDLTQGMQFAKPLERGAPFVPDKYLRMDLPTPFLIPFHQILGSSWHCQHSLLLALSLSVTTIPTVLPCSMPSTA